MPSILFETGYISNPSDAAFIDSPKAASASPRACAARSTSISRGGWRPAIKRRRSGRIAIFFIGNEKDSAVFRPDHAG